MVACSAIVAVSAELGLRYFASLSGVGACLLLAADIMELVEDWNRDPPLQDDINKLIDELLCVTSLRKLFISENYELFIVFLF